jgi:hypothetical protein
VVGLFIFVKSIYLYRATSQKVFLINGFAVLNMCSGFMFGHFIGIMALFSVVPGGDGWTGLDLLSRSYANLATMFVTLMISHGYSLFYNFRIGGESETIINLAEKNANSPKIGSIILGDFGIRLFLMQFIVIVGGVIIVLTKTTIYLSAIFIVLKTVIDLSLHRKKHKQYVVLKTKLV